MGVTFNKKGNSEEEIVGRINKDRGLITSINPILWNKTLREITKKKDI